MEKEHLKEIILDQRSNFMNRTDLIDRHLNLDTYISTNQVVIISGIRRCGKSSLLSIIKNRMSIPAAEYCYFNFDDERIIAETSILNDIYSLHLELFGVEPVFFFDEIQLVKGWEKFVNRMYESGHKLFITGSNATLLSSEIATSLTGRNKVLELFPFSFAEYIDFIHHKYDPDLLNTRQKSLLIKDLNTYLECGGFPLVIKENDPELIDSLFSDILYRDIVARYNITQVDQIKAMSFYLFSNVGKIFSYSTLKDVAGLKSVNSVSTYLQYLERTYLLNYLRKYDSLVKKQLKSSRKVYTVDTALANRLGFRFSENKGRLLENVVFVELKRRGEDVYYYSGRNECDFLIKDKIHIVEALQVAWQLNHENVKRELSGLQEVMAEYSIAKGTVIVMDTPDKDFELPENISVVPVWKWLLEKI